MHVKKHFKIIITFALFLFALSGCSFTKEKNETTFPTADELAKQNKQPEQKIDFNNKIFFSRQKKGDIDFYPIFVMDKDGQNQIQLFPTDDFIETRGKIEFAANSYFLYPKLDGDIVKIMSYNPGNDSKKEFISEYPKFNKNQPTIFDNGKKLGFVLTDDQNNKYIAIADLSGKIIQEFKDNPMGVTQTKDPSFSYDSSSMLFTALVLENSSNIFSRSLQNQDSVYQYTNDGFLNSGPFYLKDHSKIIFVSNRTGKLNIFSMDNYGIPYDAANVNTTTRIPAQESIKQLTFDGENKSPSLSPDGKEMVFISNRDGNWEIYKMNIDGSTQTRLTQNDVDDLSPGYYFNYSSPAKEPPKEEIKEEPKENNNEVLEVDQSDPQKIASAFCQKEQSNLLLENIAKEDWFEIPADFVCQNVKEVSFYMENFALVPAVYKKDAENLFVNYILKKEGLTRYIIIARYNDKEEITLGDAKNYLDFKLIQNAVDSGKDAYRLDPFMAVKEDSALFGFNDKDNFFPKQPADDFIKAAHKGILYNIYVYQPVKSGAEGIWAVKSIKRIAP